MHYEQRHAICRMEDVKSEQIVFPLVDLCSKIKDYPWNSKLMCTGVDNISVVILTWTILISVSLLYMNAGKVVPLQNMIQSKDSEQLNI